MGKWWYLEEQDRNPRPGVCQGDEIGNFLQALKGMWPEGCGGLPGGTEGSSWLVSWPLIQKEAEREVLCDGSKMGPTVAYANALPGLATWLHKNVLIEWPLYKGEGALACAGSTSRATPLSLGHNIGPGLTASKPTARTRSPTISFLCTFLG